MQLTVEPEKRFAFVDALRGIAMLSIACFHFYLGSFSSGLGFQYPAFVHPVFAGGWIGFVAFFFISGFVVAYRLHSAQLTSRFFFSYYMRRLIRLGIPYWTAIAIILIIRSLISLNNSMFPELAVILKNIFFMQILFDVETIVPGAWTLIVEFQLYFVMLVLMAVLQYITQNTRFRFAINILIVFSPITIISMLDTAGLKLFDLGALCGSFLPYWYMFFTGAMLFWVVSGKIPRYFFWGFFALASTLLFTQWEPNLFATLVLCSLFYIWGVYMHGRTCLTNRLLQYFAKISYSFYLIHMVTMLVVFRIIIRVWGGTGDNFLIWFIVTLAICIFAAQLLYSMVEKPSALLSRKF